MTLSDKIRLALCQIILSRNQNLPTLATKFVVVIIINKVALLAANTFLENLNINKCFPEKENLPVKKNYFEIFPKAFTKLNLNSLSFPNKNSYSLYRNSHTLMDSHKTLKIPSFPQNHLNQINLKSPSLNHLSSPLTYFRSLINFNLKKFSFCLEKIDYNLKDLLYRRIEIN